LLDASTHVVPAGFARGVSAVVLTVNVLEPALANDGAALWFAIIWRCRSRTWASFAVDRCRESLGRCAAGVR
jgi:hypothetical protein